MVKFQFLNIEITNVFRNEKIYQIDKSSLSILIQVNIFLLCVTETIVSLRRNHAR